MYVAVRPPTSTVHIFNLIRLDLAYPLTGRAIKGGRLNANWKFEDEATLLALHARLEEYFQDEPFGMYHAVVELVGHDRADALVESGQLKRRVGILREPSTQMTAPATMAGSSTAGPSGSLPRSASAHTGSFSVIPTREHTTTLAERYNIQPPAPATAVARVSSREGTHVRRTGLQDAAPHNSAGSRPSVAPGRSQPPQPTQGMSEKRAGKQRTCLFCTLIRSQYADVIYFSGTSRHEGTRAYADGGCPCDRSTTSGLVESAAQCDAPRLPRLHATRLRHTFFEPAASGASAHPGHGASARSVVPREEANGLRHDAAANG